MGSDPVTAAAVTAGGSLAGGLLGGKKQTSTQTTKPYLSPEAEAGWKSLIDRGIAESQKPFEPIPLARVGAPQSVFDSQGLYDLQNYSDSVGGLLSPLRGSAPKQAAEAPKATDPVAAPAITNSAVASMISNPAMGMKQSNQLQGWAQDPTQSKYLNEILTKRPELAANPYELSKAMELLNAGVSINGI